MRKNFDNGVASLGAEHDRVFGNLPWFVNQTLVGNERQEANAHLSCCLVCRRELAALKALREAVTSRTAEPRCEAALGRLHERMNERAFRRRVVPWAAAAVLVLVLGLTGVVAFNAGVMSSSREITASAPVGATTAAVVDEALANVPAVVDGRAPTLPSAEGMLADTTSLPNIDEVASGRVATAPSVQGNYVFVPLWHVRKASLYNAASKTDEVREVIFFEPILSSATPSKKD